MKPTFLIVLAASAANIALALSETLNPIVVTEQMPPVSYTVPSFQTSKEALNKVAGGSSVLDPQIYLTGRSSTMSDTFSFSPGVIAQSRFGSDEARLSIRGSGIQRTFHGRGIKLLQDGVPLNLADGGFDMQSVNPLTAQYINVWRGANALTNGSSNLGGAMDYITHTGMSHPYTSARLEAGSFAYLRTQVASGFQNGKQDGYISYSHQQQDGYRDWSKQSNDRLFANVAWKINSALETRFYLTAVQSDSELPGNLTWRQLKQNPRQANAGNLALAQKRDYDLVRIANKTSWQQGEHQFHLSTAWSYKNLDHPIFQVLDQESNDAYASLQYAYTNELFGRHYELKSGLSYQSGITQEARYENKAGRRGQQRSANQQRAQNLECYLENQLDLGSGFTGILGFSVSNNWRKNRNNLNLSSTGAVVPFPQNSSYSRRYENIAPKAGILWSKGNQQVFANASGSYEPPSFSEAGTAMITNQSQDAVTYEIGTRGAYAWARWDASVYHACIQNELLGIQLPPPAPLGNTATINADQTIHQGVELLAELDLLGNSWEDSKADQRLTAMLAWTYSNFYFDEDAVYGNNKLGSLPPQWIHAALMWKNTQGYYAGPTLEWSPAKTYVDLNNSLAAKPYALLGFKLGRRTSGAFSWFIEAKNLTNERYATSTGLIENAKARDVAQFLPGDGRSLFIGLEKSF